jgi:hypothetical protein
LAALQLASKIQEYKDEKANELRSQIEREQGERATKAELQAAVEKVQAERKVGGQQLTDRTVQVLGLFVLIITALILYHS